MAEGACDLDDQGWRYHQSRRYENRSLTLGGATMNLRMCSLFGGLVMLALAGCSRAVATGPEPDMAAAEKLRAPSWLKRRWARPTRIQRPTNSRLP